jgi:hypothetical protein
MGDWFRHLIPGVALTTFGLLTTKATVNAHRLKQIGTLLTIALTLGIVREGSDSVADGNRFFALSYADDVLHQVAYAGFLPAGLFCLLEAHSFLPAGSYIAAVAAGFLN